MAWRLPSEVQEEAKRYAREVSVSILYVNLVCEWLVYLSGMVQKEPGETWRDTLEVFPDVVAHPFFPVMESRFLDVCAEAAKRSPRHSPSISKEFATVLLDMMASACR
jgi:hypothetical protein